MTSYPPEDRKPSLLYLKEAVFSGTKVIWSSQTKYNIVLLGFKLHLFFLGTGKRPCMYLSPSTPNSVWNKKYNKATHNLLTVCTENALNITVVLYKYIILLKIW